MIPRVSWQQLYDAFNAMAPRDHTLARMNFSQAMAHRAWRHVIFNRAVHRAQSNTTQP